MKRKNILITGASSGLGRGMALEFAKHGHNLALCARRLEKLVKLKAEIRDIKPNTAVFIRSLDVVQTQNVFSVFQQFELDFNGIGEQLDRVIVNAGMGKGGSIGKGYAAANIETAQTNFCGALTQMEAAMEIFRAQNHGHLVLISSMSAFRGYSRAMTVYAATKAGLKSLAEGLRVDVLHKPIIVSSIFPGYIATEMTEALEASPPFMVSLDKGSKLLVKAINREKPTAYVPFWPWFFAKRLMPFMTVGMLRRF